MSNIIKKKFLEKVMVIIKNPLVNKHLLNGVVVIYIVFPTQRNSLSLKSELNFFIFNLKEPK